MLLPLKIAKKKKIKLTKSLTEHVRFAGVNKHNMLWLRWGNRNVTENTLRSLYLNVAITYSVYGKPQFTHVFLFKI